MFSVVAQIWHDVEDMKLALTIIQAGNLPLRSNGDQPYTFITGKMLFEDRGFDMFETKVIHSSNPIYNETFVFHEVDTVDVLHLEVLLWDKKQHHHDKKAAHSQSSDDADEFMGMVQLPLSEANLEDEPRWYELRDRQTRKPSTSSVTFKSSSAESGDSCRKMPPLLSAIKHQARTKSSGDLLVRTSNRLTTTPARIDSNRKHSTLQSNTVVSKSRQVRRGSLTGPTVPPILMNSIDDEDNDEPNVRHRSIITVQSVKLKRRISKGILKLFDLHTRRFSETVAKPPESPPAQKLSSHIPINIDTEDEMDLPVGMAFESTTMMINKSPRQSVASMTHPDDQSSPTLIRPIPLQQMPIGQLMLPYIPSSRHSSISGSRKSSAASYCESDDDIDRYFTLSEQREQQVNESTNVQTHTVGPGQVTPRNYENMINDYIYMGQIQLGLIVTKGLLEIDVICARGLERVIDESNHSAARSEDLPPDTYVKT